MSVLARLRDLVGLVRRTQRTQVSQSRDPVTHVILLDGTMSSLESGEETNIGLIYKLLCDVSVSGRASIFYEAGVQWNDWAATLDVIEGRGINRQIRRAYGWLASRYRPGDRIFLIGFSRGAYAVRSLAGAIGHIGLLQKAHATERMVREAYRHYQCDTDRATAASFRGQYCHDTTEIEAVAVFDTVKALGFRAPFIWKWSEVKHAFHNHHLGPHVKHGFHALALHETREAFMPVLWTTPDDHPGHVEQVWFAGGHGDVGGQLTGSYASRPFSNIPLTWMLGKLDACGLPLPADWRARFPTDIDAPRVGAWRGWGRLFLARRNRVVGADPSESLHPSALGAARSTGLPLSKNATMNTI